MSFTRIISEIVFMFKGLAFFKAIENKISDIRKKGDDLKRKFTIDSMISEIKKKWKVFKQKITVENMITVIGERWDDLKQIIENMLNSGNAFSIYMIGLNNRRVEAEIDIAEGRLAVGVKKLFEIVELNDRMITRMCYFDNKRNVQECSRNLEDNYFRLISVIMQNSSELKEDIPKLSDVILRRKAIILEIGSAQRDNILLTNDLNLKAKLYDFRDCQIKMARLMMEGQKHQKEIDDLKKKSEQLETELASKLPEVELKKKLEAANHKNITAQLPEDACLVDFVKYKPYDFNKKKWLSHRYSAFIIFGSHKMGIRLIDFGDAAEIETLISQYRAHILNESEKRTIVVTGKDQFEKTMINPNPTSGKSLCYKTFQLILYYIGRCRKIYISPDGDIALLPFESLPLPDNRYVVEDFEISYIDSGRDILRFQHHQKSKSLPIVIADPNYDLTSESTKGKKKSPLRDVKVGIKKEQHCYFHRLEGTRQEGESVRNLLKFAIILLDNDVLDEEVKKIRSPEILHIATHGFFISKLKGDYTEVLLSILNIKKFENPLLRSGLALAGANAFLQGKSPAEYAGDGLLIASDVTGMDLTGTDLVVLSACQTGLGEVRSGEGIYGLRRAFTIAGARTQIVSLWSVPDYETKELMISFYTKLSDGKGKAEALREAQRELIAKLRNEGKADYPFLWGAFICVGDPDKMKRTSSFWFRGGAL